MKTRVYIMALALAALMTSCVTPRRVNYLQDMTHGSQIELENRFEARIAPADELSIVVSAPNDQLAKPFNVQSTAQGESGHGYLVDVNGDIDFPELGRIHVAGLTRLRLQDTLAMLLESGGYLDDPYVSVRFSNFKIFYLGAGTGKVITISNERCTFLEALAMMGGLDNYTRRDRVAVMREVDGVMVTRYLDPRSSDVFNDPFFMLQQNDFIITDGVNSGTIRSELTYWTGIASTLLSAASLIVSLAMLKTLNEQ